MYKSKLQELCQRRSWELPEYKAVKDGPDHMPRFNATVNVHGQQFTTPDPCKSSKDAQNTAARIAFEHFSSNPPLPSPQHFTCHPPSLCPDAPMPQIQPVAVSADPPPLPLSPFPSSLPDPPLGLLMTKYHTKTKPANEEVLQENCYDATECPMDYAIALGSKSEDTVHMYKNLLQQYAQKESISFPVYTSEAEGPPHARRFKSKVSVNGKSYETLEFFPTLKEAEQASAKIACQTLSVDVTQEDKGLYKNLLQEFAQKKGLMCPSYETKNSGLSHTPIFVSTVDIGSNSFRGGEAKTKKQADMNAAKVAYYALTKGCPPTNSLIVSPVNSGHVDDNLPQNILPTATIEKLQDATCPKPTLTLAGCPPTNSSMVSPVDSSSFTANLSQNIQPGATAEKHQDETKEGENKPFAQWKTVVYPRKSNCPIPENALVMQYSNDQWVAYRVELDPKSTA